MAHTFFVDGFEYGLYEFWIHAAEASLGTALVEYFVVASGLEHGHVMFFLERTDFAADTHTLGEDFHQGIVTLVYLLAQFVQAFGGLVLLADDQQVEDVIQHIGRYLLGGIAPGTVRIAM